MRFGIGDTVKAKKTYRKNKKVFFVHRVSLPSSFEVEGWPDGMKLKLKFYDGKIGLARSEKELRERSKIEMGITSKWNDYVTFKTLLTERVK